MVAKCLLNFFNQLNGITFLFRQSTKKQLPLLKTRKISYYFKNNHFQELLQPTNLKITIPRTRYLLFGILWFYSSLIHELAVDERILYPQVTSPNISAYQNHQSSVYHNTCYCTPFPIRDSHGARVYRPHDFQGQHLSIRFPGWRIALQSKSRRFCRLDEKGSNVSLDALGVLRFSYHYLEARIQ